MKLPRIDQVSELTRGLRLPMPAVASVHLSVILDGIRRAFEGLVADYGAALATKSESELNSLLQGRFNSLCAGEKLLSLMVACVVRGGESVSFDGARLELRPDLGIYLTGRHRSFPLVVECKIVDEHTGKGIDLYCVNGIRRFVDGEYAWGSSQGLMIAYVRDGSTVGDSLVPYLLMNAKKNPDPFLTEVIPSEGSDAQVWLSRHARGFTYMGSANDKPGSIDISHLWFDSPNSVVA